MSTKNLLPIEKVDELEISFSSLGNNKLKLIQLARSLGVQVDCIKGSVKLLFTKPGNMDRLTIQGFLATGQVLDLGESFNEDRGLANATCGC